MELSHSGVVCITKREKAESEAQRGKPKGTLEWCGSVVIDRRGDQLGKVLVCFHAVTLSAPNPICCRDSGGRAGFLTKPYKN